MSVHDSHAKISQAARKLDQRWQETKTVWKDSNCRAFEQNYMLPLQSELKKTTLALERMAAVLDKVRQSCG